MGDALDRFVRAQDADGTFLRALAELRGGTKTSHWMWFVFPQLAGLGRSTMARRFAIANADEARAYLAHPVLAPRLVETGEAMLGWAGRRTADMILGPVDAMKFASSMTLFDQVAADRPNLFSRALDSFCAGRRDAATLSLLAAAPLP